MKTLRKADELKVKNTVKLPLFFLLGMGLTFGLLIQQAEHLLPQVSESEPGQHSTEMDSALSGTVRARAQMLSNLKHDVSRYMSKHDDYRPGVRNSKRQLLYQLPGLVSTPIAGIETSPTISFKLPHHRFLKRLS